MKKLIFLILVSFLLVSCVQEKQVELKFMATVNGEPLNCGQWYSGFNTDRDAKIQLKDFRFFVSEVNLIDEAGEKTPLVLEQDSIWQFQNIALLDFENGQGECEEKGNTPTNSTVRGKVSGKGFKAISFKLGVPYEWNHVDNVAVPSPLNVGAMFWNWQFGYKFARFDLVTDQEDKEKFWFIHLGSTGCESESFGTAPEIPCMRLNFPEILIEDFDIENDMIVADLGALINQLAIGTCMSGPDNPRCEELFPRFGLSLASGNCEGDCLGQKFFSKRQIESYAQLNP